MQCAILLATYNGEKYLEAQLQSLAQQTYRNFMVYISDDCSCDSTQNIINRWTQKDSRFVDVHNTVRYGNATGNFLSLLALVEADVYMFCDQDDVWFPQKIETLLHVYELRCSPETPSLVYADMQVVDENLHIIHQSIQAYMGVTNTALDYKRYLTANNIAGCAMLINKTAADMVRKNMHTFTFANIILYDFLLAQIVSLTGRIVYIDEPLVMYRQHSTNSVGAKRNAGLAYLLRKVHIAQAKKELIRCEKQIGEIICSPIANCIDAEILSVCKTFSCLYTRSKAERVAFFIGGGFCAEHASKNATRF